MTTPLGEAKDPMLVERATSRFAGATGSLHHDATGQAYVIRPACAEDRRALDALRRATEACGPQNSYFGATDPTTPSVETGESWPTGGATVVAERDGQLVGGAHFARLGSSTDATIAVAVLKAPAQREIGAQLVTALAVLARAAGVEHFSATLATKNAALLAIFASAGFATEIGVGDGIMHARFGVEPASAGSGRSSVRAVPVWAAVTGDDASEAAAS